jgi:hypothetical protein
MFSADKKEKRTRNYAMPNRRAAPSSDGHLEATGPIIPGSDRTAPPRELRPAECLIWNRIVARLPADWFTAENEPLLKELCRHIAFADELVVKLDGFRQKITALDEQVMADGVDDKHRLKLIDKLSNRFNVLLRMHGYQSERIGNLATKLRLTNQSRYQSQKAHDQAARTAPGPKPWENWH